MSKIATAVLSLCLIACGSRGVGVVLDAGGGDGATLDSGAELSAAQFCSETKYWTATRDYARGEITEAQRDAMIASIESTCVHATFADCTPTQARLEACIAALTNVDRLGEATDSISECTDDALCPRI